MRETGSFTICLSHDVDRVRKTYQYLTHDCRRGRIRNLAAVRFREEPYWNFERIAAIEDRYGVRSTWFFLEESIPFSFLRPRGWKLSLGRYSVKEPDVRAVMRWLNSGGWEIGLHGSYLSYRDGALLKAEKEAIEESLGEPVRGIRQHYLNLDVPETWKLQRRAGLEYDASFGYRRGLGWRGGRMRPFHDSASGMWIHPLTIMECNLLTEAAGSWERAWLTVLEFMEQAERECGLLSVLWHPHFFCERDFPGYTLMYERIIREGIARGADFKTCEEAVWAARHPVPLVPGQSER